MTTSHFPKSTIVGELREWREVHLRETSYYAGNLIRTQSTARHAKPHITGFRVDCIDRGDYYLVKVAGGNAYLLYKNREYK